MAYCVALLTNFSDNMTALTFIAKVIGGTIITLFTIGLLIALAWPSPDEVQQGVNDLYSQTAESQIEQYHLAAKHGTAIEQCVAAQQVATAYRMANDEKNYEHWKGVERIDCAAAGMPSY